MPDTPTRFPKGLTNVSAIHQFNRLGVPYPPKWHVYWNDFDHYAAGDWTETVTQAGSGSASVALTDIEHGGLLYTNDNADDDAVFAQKKGESFKFVLGRQLFYEIKVSINEVIQKDFIAGLIITDTTPLANSDGVYFISSDGAATVSFVVNKNAVATTFSAIATLVAGTSHRLGFYFNGVDTITAYFDGAGVATYTVAATLPDDEELTITHGLQQGEVTNIKTMTVDYVFVAAERFPAD